MTAATARPFLDSIAVRDEGGDRFSGKPQYVPWPKAYGGDSVAQAAAAATRTVAADRMLHSLHSYFLRPVDIGERVLYQVDRTRDGRGFSHRAVVGRQGDKDVIHATMSFATAGGDDVFGVPFGRPVTPPEELPSAEQYLRDAGALDDEAGRYWASGRSFDIRHDPSPVYGAGPGDAAAQQAVWIRAASAIPADPVTQRLALAYVCDYTILEPLLRLQGWGWRSAGLATASLDHAMWLHRPADLNDWVLYLQDAVSVQDGRGLAWGRFYSRDGALVASLAQEGVLRRAAPAATDARSNG